VDLVAHDLRASLNALASWGEVLRVGQLSPADLAQAGESVVRQVHLLSRRIDDAMDLWRVEAEPDSGPLSSMLDGVVQAAAAASSPAMKACGVTCSIDVASNLHLKADARRLRHALKVLLQEAAWQTPAGGWVRVWAGRDGDRARLTVDTSGHEDGPALRAGSRRTPFPAAVLETLVALSGGRLEKGRDGTTVLDLPLASPTSTTAG
jgi:signal transduction histidine kinase